MADPLLTSLCAICHIQAPRYRCPRCRARTCSLACVKKHKNWSSCNGERDPTVFVPREKLKTDAGIDHDYNFLAKIERSVERAERVFREDRGVLPQEDSNPPPNKKARLHKGWSRGKVTLDTSSRKWDRNSLHRIRELGINVSSVPYGMTRSRENTTSWNKRTRAINWQVEWFDWTTDSSTDRNANPTPTRILHKILDETPLYVGFSETQEYHRQQQLSNEERALEKKALRKQRGLAKGGQDVISTAWQAQPSWMQNQAMTSWSDPTVRSGLSEDENSRDKYQFFFQKPRIPSRELQRLLPSAAEENLATLLRGLEVVEFPTIHVFPAGASTPPNGYVIEKRPGQRRIQKKRKRPAIVEYASSMESSGGEEDGELVENNSENRASLDEDDDTSSSGSDSSDSGAESDLEMS
ncbi:hypothetical protein F5X99DRAFT_366061 [Biscogniauxia marginata]|nr:hypothetical protein F5X99DRAFT_366061 [Biscogniauxia marginata]